MSDSAYTVGKVAEVSGVSVRTLHHYDEIGLVRASGRTAAGYRVYEPADIERLRHVLTYRQLGFSLEEIATLLDDPEIDEIAHLVRQRQILLDRREDLTAMVAAIEAKLQAERRGVRLTPEEQLEVFGTDKVGGEWAEEAEQRWGDTDAYQESARRTATYTKDDWQRLKAESDEALQRVVATMQRGLPPTSGEAMDLAEEHRAYLSRWFYDCSHDMHVNLASMYVADDRFRATFEATAAGLADYLGAAVTANAARHRGSSS